MPLSPLCLVNNGTSFVPTENGVDVSPGATVSIRLAQPTGVTLWLLQVTGTDELTAVPTLTGVNASAQVATPSTVVTFQFPPRAGSALGFRSDVEGPDGALATTFGVYSRTASNARVGFTTETREGNTTYGWAAKINPVIRSSGILVVEAPYNKHMPALLTTGVGRELACSTGLAVTPHPQSALNVSINGILVTDIGYESTSGCACYWSSDGGVTAKARPNIAQNDRLYWNGAQAEFNLHPTDFIDFWYDAVI